MSDEREIMYEIDKLFRDNCEECQIKLLIRKEHGVMNEQQYCLNLCKVGQKLTHLGRRLEADERVAAKLTKERYEALKLQGKTDRFIAKKFNIGINTLGRRKKKWGLSTFNKFAVHNVREYHAMKARGYNDKAVARAWGIGNTTIRRWKIKWGLIQEK